MEMPSLAGQNDDASGRIGFHLVAVERLAKSDVEDARHDRIDAVFRMLVRHQLCPTGHLNPDPVGTRFRRMTDQHSEASRRWKSGKWFPLDVFRQDRTEHGLAGLMIASHGNPF